MFALCNCQSAEIFSPNDRSHRFRLSHGERRRRWTHNCGHLLSAGVPELGRRVGRRQRWSVPAVRASVTLGTTEGAGNGRLFSEVVVVAFEDDSGERRLNLSLIKCKKEKDYMF